MIAVEMVLHHAEIDGDGGTSVSPGSLDSGGTSVFPGSLDSGGTSVFPGSNDGTTSFPGSLVNCGTSVFPGSLDNSGTSDLAVSNGGLVYRSRYFPLGINHCVSFRQNLLLFSGIFRIHC